METNENIAVSQAQNPDDLAFLNEKISIMQSLENEQEIYEFAAESIFQLLQGSAIITIADVDARMQSWKLRLVKGIGNKYEKVRHLLGFDIRNIRGEVNPKYADSLASSRFVELDINFPELLNKKISSKAGNMLKKLFSIEHIYCAGIHHNDNHYANITLIQKSGCAEINFLLIEAFIKMVAVFVDKINAEEKLIKNEEQQRLLLTKMGIGLGYYDLNGKLIFFNEKAAENLGGKPGDFVNKSLHDLFTKEEADKYLGRIKDAVDSGKDKEYYDKIHFAGRELWFISIYSRINDAIGNARGVQIVSLNISRQKKAELALKESEERLALALKSARQGIYDLNVQSGETIVNEEYASMLGYNPEDFHETNQNWIERLHPDDRERVAREYHDYIKGKIEKYHVEFRQRTAGNKWKWILSHGEIVSFDQNGKPLRMLGTHTDLTGIKKVENELRESKNLLQGLFDHMSSGFAYHKIITDKNNKVVDYVFLDVNKAFERHLGLKAADVIGKRVTQVLPGTESDPANWLEIYGEVAQTGKARNFEEYSRSVGRWFHIDVYSPQRGYFATTFEDITDRKKAEETLKQKAEIINSTTDGIITTDLKGEILTWNEGSEKIYGYQADEVIGKRINMLYKENDRIKLKGLIDQLIKGDKIENIELNLLHKSGKEVPSLLSLSSIKDDKGDVRELVGFSRENAALKEIQTELQKRNDFVQTILDRLPIGIALNKFNEGTATYINDKFEEIYGWPKEEMKDIEQFFLKAYPDKEYREKIMQQVIADIASEDPDRMHWENVMPTTKNGERKIVNSVNIPILEQNTMVSTVMDVTDLKKAENELQKHKEKLEELVKERTKELELANKDLQDKNKELAHFNELFIGREFRINELKEELAILKEKLKKNN